MTTPIQIFANSSPYTYTVPNGISSLKFNWVIGGGGGGGGGRPNAVGGGGGSAAYVSNYVLKCLPGDVFIFSVGAGGAGGPANSSTGVTGGSDGGFTIVNKLTLHGSPEGVLYVEGGGGGGLGVITYQGVQGAGGSAGLGFGLSSSGQYGGSNSNSVGGIGGAGPVPSSSGGLGSPNLTSSGTVGIGYGSGGGGGQVGGNGADGLIEFIPSGVVTNGNGQIQTWNHANGQWRLSTDIYVKVSGAWISMSEVWTKVNGVWELVFIKGFVFNDIVSGYNYNLRAKALAAGWDGVLPLLATLTVSGTVGCTYTNSAYYDWLDYTIRYGQKVGGGAITVDDVIADLNAIAPRTIFFPETKSLNLPNSSTILGYPIAAAMYHWQVYGQYHGYILNVVPAIPSFDTGQLSSGSKVVMTLPPGTAILGSGGGTGGLPANINAYSGTPGTSGAGGSTGQQPGTTINYGVYPTQPGGAGGCAINAQYPITIINNGLIGGGGGGGAGGPPVGDNWGGGGGGGAGHCYQMSGNIYSSDVQASVLGNSITIPVATGTLNLNLPTLAFLTIGPGVTIVNTDNTANFLNGTCTSFDFISGNASINITSAYGSGTMTNWAIVPLTTSTLSISTGAKSFAGAWYFYNEGMQVTLRDVSNSANFMSGTITSTSVYGEQPPATGGGIFSTPTYTPSNISFNCTSVGGSGNASLWSVITSPLGLGGLGSEGWTNTSGWSGFGQSGLSLTGGNGGVGYFTAGGPTDWQSAAPGGRGGDLAQPGQATIVQGGAPGPAVTGSANVIWQVYGQVIGALL